MRPSQPARPGPPRPPQPPRPRKPPLPDERPHLPGDVWGELKASTRQGEVDDVAKAYGAAGEALTEGDSERGVQLLRWAKDRAPRSAFVREGLGVALYLAGDLKAAQPELLAYRRISGRADQNHLLADCARAVGRLDLVASFVEEMEAGGVPLDRVVEGKIVLAGARADKGDLDGAMATLEQVPADTDHVAPWHLRLWYAAGDVADRQGDRARARDYFEAVEAVDEDFHDVAERLAALPPP